MALRRLLNLLFAGRGVPKLFFSAFPLVDAISWAVTPGYLLPGRYGQSSGHYGASLSSPVVPVEI
jgi:hypothetical protein